MRVLWLTAALLCLAPAGASAEVEGFADPEQNARYQRWIREVRCVQCQNTSIAGSNVELAADLRTQIHEMIAEGATDKEITDFLVTRYGDFILYRPPVKPTTWALWGAPLAMLGVGLVVFWRVARSRAGQTLDDDEDEGPEAEP